MGGLEDVGRCEHLRGTFACEQCKDWLRRVRAQRDEATAELIVALRNNAKALLRAAQQHELLSDQVNWFDASTHHGDWGPADVDATGLVSPKAVCRICQHAPDWHYPSAHARKARLLPDDAMTDNAKFDAERAASDYLRSAMDIVDSPSLARTLTTVLESAHEAGRREGTETAADILRRLAQELEHISGLPDHADQRVRAKRLREIERKIRALLEPS